MAVIRRDGGGSIGRRLGPGAEEAAARDCVLGGQREPRGEVLLGRPPAHIGADLGEQFQRGVGCDAVDLGEVDAAGQLIQRTPDLKPGFMVAGTAIGAVNACTCASIAVSQAASWV